MFKVKWSDNTRMILGIIVTTACACVLIGVGMYSAVNPTDYTKLDYDKYITVGTYKGLEYSISPQKVSDEDVREAAKQDINSQGTLLQTHEPAKEGDTVVIDYTGLIDGQIFEGGSEQNATLTLGSHAMIDGFENAIVGHEEGDTFSVDLVFPDDYEEKSVAGKPVTFEITLKYVTSFDALEYNDENVASHTEYKTMKEHQAAVRKDLEQMAAVNAEDAAIIQLWEQVLETSKVKEYPKAILKKQIKEDTEGYVSYLTETGESLEEALKDEGITKKEWDKRVEDAAKSTVETNLLVYAIADKENIDISKKAYKQYTNDELKELNMTEEEFEANQGMSLSEYMNDPNAYLSFIYRRVGEKLMELGVEKE